ncbi:MAG: oxidative stress defense protein [Vibrio sp.]|uniref:oxidative stress defense protein n=1 Tax=Vibrio sp. TaxID=678 RepID=UPI003A8A9D99
MKALSGLLLMLLSSVSTLAAAQEFNFPHVVTSGYGEVVATPDMAQFSVKVVEVTMNVEQAKENVDTVVSAFSQRLMESGVDKEQISSSNLYITPQYHYPKTGKAELVGYRAVRSVTVDVDDLSKLNQYLDIALQENINQVDDIELKVRDKEKYQQQARRAAINDAQDKAQQLAVGFGKKLKGVWRIEYHSPQNQPVMMRSTAFNEKSAVGDTYQDAKLTIRDNVNVVFELD